MNASTVETEVNSFASLGGNTFLPPTQDEINDSLQRRLRELEDVVGFIPQGAADPISDDTCDDPNCGCQDDEGVVGGIYPEPTIEDVVDGIIEMNRIGIAALRDIALNSDDEMAAVEAANSLIGWGQVAAEKIDAIERDDLVIEVEEILNSILDSGETTEQDENAVGSPR